MLYGQVYLLYHYLLKHMIRDWTIHHSVMVTIADKKYEVVL